MYSFTEKSKKMEEEDEDMNFLASLSGIAMNSLERP